MWVKTGVAGVKMGKFIDHFVSNICKYQKIAIFVHEDPDFDALGSAFGLRDIIKTSFKEKEVHVMKMQTAIDLKLTLNFMPAEEEIGFDENEFINGALGISVDGPCLTRVLGADLLKKCETTIRIDHHEYVECFTNFEYVDPKASSACELATIICNNANLFIPQSAATFLYAGIVTDTNCFRFSNTSINTFQAVILLDYAHADRQLVHRVLYTRDLNVVKYENYLFGLAKFEDHVGSLWIPKGSNEPFKVPSSHPFVYLLSAIRNYPIYACARWNDLKQTYSCSLRSNDPISILEVAKKYHGGGHKQASGCTVKDEQEFNELVNDLKNTYKQYETELINHEHQENN